MTYTQILYTYTQAAILLGYADDGVIRNLVQAGKLRPVYVHLNGHPRIHWKDLQALDNALDPTAKEPTVSSLYLSDDRNSNHPQTLEALISNLQRNGKK